MSGVLIVNAAMILSLYVFVRLMYGLSVLMHCADAILVYSLERIDKGEEPVVFVDDMVSLAEYVFLNPFEFRRSKVLKSKEAYQILKPYM